MVDTVDRATRRRIMQSIKGRNTKPERMLYRALKKINLKPIRWNKSLPGKPDFTFMDPKAIVPKLAVMVDGCFWHVHESHFKLPKTNISFWRHKLTRNMARDLEVNKLLSEAGWPVFRIWECDVKKDPDGCAMMISRYMYLD